MSPETFEQMLTGGHPNSLGRTAEVLDIVLRNPTRLDDLYDCYTSDDEVVRLRTSSAMKRVCAQKPDWLMPYLDRLISEVAALPQASAQWTLAQLFAALRTRMTVAQRDAAMEVMKRNLDHDGDWIVQNHTMQTLADWSSDDPTLRDWLLPRLRERTREPRKSVAGRARKLLERVGG
jgi:hypothetical protein